MCVDVYSDILPMNDMFLQKRKIIREIVKSTPRYIRDKGSVGRRATPSEGDDPIGYRSGLACGESWLGDLPVK